MDNSPGRQLRSRAALQAYSREGQKFRATVRLPNSTRATDRAFLDNRSDPGKGWASLIKNSGRPRLSFWAADNGRASKRLFSSSCYILLGSQLEIWAGPNLVVGRSKKLFDRLILHDSLLLDSLFQIDLETSTTRV